MIPQKWFIKRNPDNYIEINEWFNKTLGTTYKSTGGILYYPEFHGAFSKEAIEQGFIEMTTDFFREHITKTGPILNESYSIY